MPWSVADVESHKKGLTPEQKKKWVKIANAALKSCNARDGSDCDGYAIRVANSKVGSKKMSLKNKIIKKQTINKNALCMSSPLEPVFSGVDVKKPDGMTMLAYSGKVIPNHYFWGDLAIDIKGIKFPKEIYPILEDHLTNKKIGFSSKPIIIDNALHMEDITLLDTSETWEFVRNSKKGFPYQASIFASPTKVEEVEEDAIVEVNGYSFKGPGTIWRECSLKEASVCTFGYDSNTESKAFAENDKVEIEYQSTVIHNSKLKDEESKWSTLTTENKNTLPDSAFADKKNREYPHHWISNGVMYLHRDELTAALSRATQQNASSSIQAHLKAHAKAIGMGEGNNKKKKEKLMEFDINKFAEAQPEAYAKFVKSIVTEAVKEATEKLSVEHTEKVDALTVKLTTVTEKFAAAEKENLSFKKEASIQAQNALIATANALWISKLSESDLPENLHEKVKLHVSHEKFVGDNGLDSEAFGAAIDAEIVDWTEKGVTSTVLGTGFSQKKIEKDADKLSKEVEECADEMLSLIE